MSKTLEMKMHMTKFLAWKLDPRVSKLVESTCFRWVLKIENGVYRQDINLLSALVSMYDESRNHFVIGNPKMDIDFGLEDVLYITGLPTDGEQVSGYESQDIKGTIVKQLKIDEEKAESLMMNSGSSINLSRLKSAFEAVPQEEDIGLEPYFKAYLLFLLGEVILPNNSSSFSPMYLPLLGLDVVNNYAWGAAMLANLKESLRKVKDTGKFTSLCGFSYALTVFALERFPRLRRRCGPSPLYPPPSGFPLILGWMEALCKPNKDTKNVKPVEYYQKKLQNMKESGVVWQPYKNRDLILSEEYASQLPMVFSRTPCTCFNECAYNRPDVCFKQLGKEKSHVKTSLPKMMKVKRKNLSKHKDKDWKCVNNFYKFAAEEWKKRYERFICEIARDEVTNSEPEQQEPQGVEAELQEQWEQQVTFILFFFFFITGKCHLLSI